MVFSISLGMSYIGLTDFHFFGFQPVSSEFIK